MASLKSQQLVSVSSKAAVLLVLLIIAVVSVDQIKMAAAQSCNAELSNLNVCTPFVLPGAANTNPSADCCNALHSVQQDCLCSTLRIVARLPAQCSLPPLTCGN